MEFIFTNGKSLQVGTMYCLARNYTGHAKEMQSTIPPEPAIFIKPPAAYIPSGGIIFPPKMSNLVHHELELVVVIGKECRNVHSEHARDVIAGYAVGIDVTLRDIQEKAKKGGLPWAISKGFSTSAPISEIVPAEEFGDNIPQFNLSLSVNDELRQHGTTTDMVRPVQELIEYISNIFWLQTGDCIFTGTPEGVGQIFKGDKLTAELEGFVSVSVSVG
jgi:acylpyruvate hydrolase